MKKLFWCSVVVAVAAAGSVYLASRHLDRPRAILIGAALTKVHGSNAEDDGNPVTAEELKLPEPMPAEPMGEQTALPSFKQEPADETAPMPGKVVALAEALMGQIIIDEAEGDVLPPMPPAETPAAPTALLERHAGVMPYCDDDIGSAKVMRMPYAGEEAGEEESDIMELLRSAAKEANEDAARREEEETKVKEECEEPHPYHHHAHEQYCPRGNYYCPGHSMSPAVPVVPTETKEEPKETKVESRPEGDDEEQELPHTRLDTMEFRPSDAGFHRFIPGPF